jgi:hypothetical protein
MSSESSPAAHEGERGNTVDQVAELLMADEPSVDEDIKKEEEAVHRPNDDDLVDDSEELEVVEAQESDDDVEYDDETDDSNELETDDDDGLAALASELGLDADKLTLSEDGEILVNLKVNGKDQQIDLKEAISQTQFSKANDEKARTLAEERKTFESEKAHVAEAYQQQLQQIRGLGEMLQQKLMQDFQGVDWDRLRVTDPGEWTAKQREFEIRNQELQQAGQMLGQQMRVEQEQQSQQEAQQRAEILQSEREQMIEHNPSWRDEERMKGDLTKIVEYAKSSGFDDEELQDVIYSRHVEVLKKAMLYDQGKTVADKKVKQAPKMQRASNGRFVKQKGGKVQKLIERAQNAKGANKRDAQADAVTALLMGE